MITWYSLFIFANTFRIAAPYFIGNHVLAPIAFNKFCFICSTHLSCMMLTHRPFLREVFFPFTLYGCRGPLRNKFGLAIVWIFKITRLNFCFIIVVSWFYWIIIFCSF